ncbi:MAG: MBL fold metallo-hydrolase [Anaerolineae bacterium]
MSDTLVQITDHIWIFPRDEDSSRMQPNVGIIVTPNHTVLVDGGNSPRHARRIMVALDDIQAPAVSYVIYTHSHWDHVFGSMVFGASAVGHELCHKTLYEMAARTWNTSYVLDEIQRNPARESGLRAMMKAMEDWRNFRIVQPELVFAHLMTLHVDDVRIDLEHVGGQHSPDSIVVRLPEAGVLFTGDCFHLPPLHMGKPDDTLDYAMMRSLMSTEYDHYIDGHSEPLTRKAFSKLAKG